MKALRLVLIGLLLSFIVWGAGCQPFRREFEVILNPTPEPTGEIGTPLETTNPDLTPPPS